MNAVQDVTLVLVGLEHLALKRSLIPLPGTWYDECCLCGGGLLAPLDGGCVYDGDPAVCASCGAVDYWFADEDEAHLQHIPDDGDSVDVVRRVFNGVGRGEWERRALGEDSGIIRYLVRDGDKTAPLLAQDVGPPLQRVRDGLPDKTTTTRGK
jgi:hypothetical protein